MKTSKYIWNATSHISPLKPWKPYEEREQEIHVEWSNSRSEGRKGGCGFPQGNIHTENQRHSVAGTARTRQRGPFLCGPTKWVTPVRWGQGLTHIEHPSSSLPKCSGSRQCQVSWISASSFTSDFSESRGVESHTALEAGTAWIITKSFDTWPTTVQDRRFHEHTALHLEEPCCL